jgi:putative lipoprotein
MAYALKRDRWLVTMGAVILAIVLAGCGTGAPAVPDEPDDESAEMTATPTDATTPTPADAMTPTPADATTPTPADATTPTPADAMTPTPADATTPTPADDGAAADTAALAGTTWQWVEFQDTAGQNSFTLDDPENYILSFNDDGTVSIQADCNAARGTYTAENGSLSITPGPTTLAECGPDSRYVPYIRGLRDAVSYVVEDDQLFLNLPVDAGNLVFEPADTENAAEASTAQVTGTVTYRPRIALPPDAVITVQIQDVSLADATAEIIGEQVIQAEGRQVPFDYAVSYDPDEIQPNDRYSMSARIESGDGTLLFASDTNIPVITEGNPTSEVEIVVQQNE